MDETKNTVPKDSAEGPVEDALSFLDAPSDLVPGVYEGGLKTWECSIDLASCAKSPFGVLIEKEQHFRTLEVSTRFVISEFDLSQPILWQLVRVRYCGAILDAFARDLFGLTSVGLS